MKVEQLWETYVSLPCEFEIGDESITLKFNDNIVIKDLLTGLIP